MAGVFVEVPDVAEFKVVQSQFGQDIINTFHIKKEGGWDSGSLATMAVVLISGYNDHLAGLQSTSLQYVKVLARDLSTAAGAVAEVNFPALSGGDNPSASMPCQNTLSVSHTTGIAGRSFRGRTAMAGIPENAQDGNLIFQEYVDDAIAAFDAIDGLINTAGGTWGVVSKYSGYVQLPPKYKKVPIPRDVGIFSDIINNSATRRIGSQDSRNN